MLANPLAALYVPFGQFEHAWALVRSTDEDEDEAYCPFGHTAGMQLA
jgi:hypothetical protein